MKFLQIQIILTALFFINTNIIAQTCDYDSVNIVQYTNEVEQDTPTVDTSILQGRPQPSLPTDRLVYWVHGLGGSETSWSRAATVSMSGIPGVDFDEREIVSEYKKIAYPDTENYLDMDGLAIDLAHEMAVQAEIHDNGNYNWENGIVFGHSQGGVLSRLMDERFAEGHETASTRAYGGIVTFATSNQGAQIINNRDTMQDALESFADDMAAGPLAAIVTPKSSFFRLLIESFDVDDLVEELKNIATKNIGEFLVNENLPAITEEYAVPDDNNPALGTVTRRINDYTPNSTDLVAFYAEKPKVYYKDATYYDEEGDLWGVWDLPHPISWVTIHYFLTASTSYDHFKAHEYESETPVNVFLTRRNYVSEKLEEEDLIESLNEKLDKKKCIVLDPLYPLCLAKKFKLESDLDAAETRRDAWNRGIRAIDNFNEQHLIVIGARVREEITTTQVVGCLCEDEFGHGMYWSIDPQTGECDAPPGPNMACSEITMPKTEIKWIEKPSDGVVLAESASDIPQATADPQLMEGNLLGEEDIGTTHMELRNDVTTKQALNKIFDGFVGDFFKTDKRQ